MIALVRAFGLHQGDRTPCGKPVSVAEAHTLLELSRHAPLVQRDLVAWLRLEAEYGEQAGGPAGVVRLAELRQGYAGIEVAYSELSDGAQIRYTTSDPAMVAAIHDWFAAQLGDHGGRAMDHGGP